jgi:hypothetical protein
MDIRRYESSLNPLLPRLQIPAEFRSDSVILPPKLQNLQMYVPDFSSVFSLCHSREPAVLHDPPIAKSA